MFNIFFVIFIMFVEASAPCFGGGVMSLVGGDDSPTPKLLRMQGREEEGRTQES